MEKDSSLILNRKGKVRIKTRVYKMFCLNGMWSLLFFAIVGSAYQYDWDRLHRCLTPKELNDTVQDYRENFPCIDCRQHFQSLLEIHPFPLHKVQTSEDVRVWTWFTHNLVNERLNKSWISFDIMLECLN